MSPSHEGLAATESKLFCPIRAGTPLRWLPAPHLASLLAGALGVPQAPIIGAGMATEEDLTPTALLTVARMASRTCASPLMTKASNCSARSRRSLESMWKRLPKKSTVSSEFR